MYTLNWQSSRYLCRGTNIIKTLVTQVFHLTLSTVYYVITSRKRDTPDVNPSRAARRGIGAELQRTSALCRAIFIIGINMLLLANVNNVELLILRFANRFIGDR